MERRSRNAALTEVEAAQELGVSAAVLRTWRAQGRGPTFCKFGRAVRYLKHDLNEFIEASSAGRTSKVPTSRGETNSKERAR
jgi:hypothetical protein